MWEQKSDFQIFITFVKVQENSFDLVKTRALAVKKYLLNWPKIGEKIGKRKGRIEGIVINKNISVQQKRKKKIKKIEEKLTK